MTSGNLDRKNDPVCEELLGTACWLEAYWRERDDTSFDPYDGLESDRFGWLTSLPRPVQLAVVQLHKRSPVDLRPFAKVRPTRNSYAVALFASACALLASMSGDKSFDGALKSRLEWLCETRVEDAWAYPFDVQTKTFAYPKTVPNVICTAFSVEALLDGVERAKAWGSQGDQVGRWRYAVEGAARFVLERLLLRKRGRSYFRYVPTQHLLIHNANVLAARLLVRAGCALEQDEWLTIARESLVVTLGAIGADGLLPYGEGSRESWVDGHHTGFVAEGLLDIAGMLGDDELHRISDRVRSSYRRVLFEHDGRPLLYPGRRYPIDVITGAQGIQTFAKAGDVRFAESVAGFMLAGMRTEGGTFLYRRGRLHRKAVPYVRWSDAPMCVALAHLARAFGEHVTENPRKY